MNKKNNNNNKPYYKMVITKTSTALCFSPYMNVRRAIHRDKQATYYTIFTLLYNKLHSSISRLLLHTVMCILKVLTVKGFSPV